MNFGEVLWRADNGPRTKNTNFVDLVQNFNPRFLSPDRSRILLPKKLVQILYVWGNITTDNKLIGSKWLSRIQI